MPAKAGNPRPPQFHFDHGPPQWWMIPLAIVLLLIGGLIIFAAKSGLGPFTDALF